MRKTEKNLYMLYMLFAIGLIVSNCIGAKVFDTGIMLFGNPVTITCGAIAYPLTFICTDVIGEMWGKEKASYAVRYGFICQLVATLIIGIAGLLPAVSPSLQDSYKTIFGQNHMFVIASLVAYWCSQSWDVMVFHKIRNAYIRKHGSTKGGKWIWNNGSTMTSQLIDSFLYAGIAFGFGFGWIWTRGMQIMLVNMVIGQWLIKVALAALDTPIFYLLTRHSDQ